MKIDSLKTVRKIRDKHYQETKDFTVRERIEYYRTKAASLPKGTRKSQTSSSGSGT